MKPGVETVKLSVIRGKIGTMSKHIPEHRTVTTLAELDALPEGSIVRTESYSLYVKDEIRVGPTSWWVTTNERHDFASADIELPATVLYEPAP